jgi:membrane-bound lytic murein transglycosylase
MKKDKAADIDMETDFFALPFVSLLKPVVSLRRETSGTHQSPRLRFTANIIPFQFCFNRKQMAHPRNNIAKGDLSIKMVSYLHQI